MLCCRTPFFLALAGAALSLASGQEPAAAPNPGQAGNPQAQSKPESPDKSSAQSKQDSNVLILKAPQPPQASAAEPTAPQLRAVDLEQRPKLSDQTRLELIKLIDAEFVHVRKYLPLGDKSVVINPRGQVSPGDAVLFQQAQTRGTAAKVGDKVQITGIAIHERTITLQINGGAKRKTKWYQHISIGVGGAGGSVSPTDDPNQARATGADMTLQFSKQVPEMTAEELRKLLSPVLDFAVKSAAEVYVDTLPPKIRDAIKNHEVLVGMNRDMVVMAKDRPPQKDREKDEHGKDYEEWIYGTPPQDVVFVRFYDDEVTQVKTARVGGAVTIKTQKEVDVKDGVVTLAALQASNSPEDVKKDSDQPQQPVHRPTLRREGEQSDAEILRAPNGQTTQAPEHQDEPEWGANPQQTQKSQPPPDPPKPPQ